jgi:5'-nucleotidase
MPRGHTETTSPNSVLYVGDHIFADIIVSKKAQGWRNLLVIRELEEELRSWKDNQEKYNKLLTLEWVRAEIFRGLDSQSTEPPDLSHLRKHTREATAELDKSFNKSFGSLFRSGSKQSFFSMQVQRYADLYTADYTNLLNYPLFYTFYAPPFYLSHEREHVLF